MKRTTRPRSFRFDRNDLFELFVCLLLAGIFVLLSSGAAFGQGNVGINNATPHARSLLDLTSTDKGLLTPRMTAAQRMAMFPAPDATGRGMLVYQTDGSQGFYYYDGAAWQMLHAGAGGWGLNGNAGTNVSSDFLGTLENTSLAIRTDDQERMRVSGNGNVSIGAPTDPVNFKLYVESVAQAPVLRMRNMNSAGWAGLNCMNDLGTAEMQFGIGNPTASIWANAGYAGTRTAHPLVLTSNDQERMRIAPTGEIGVGTSAPVYGLQVVRDTPGSAPMAMQCISNSGVSGTHYLGAAGSLHGVSGWANTLNAYAPNSLVHGSLSNTPATFITNSLERMRITANGSIGMGTSAPTFLLDLQGTSNATMFRIQNQGATGWSGIVMDDAPASARAMFGMGNPSSPTYAGVAYAGSFSNHPFVLASNNTERLRIVGSGEVGIGITAPTYGLHLVKDIAGSAPFAVRNLNNAGVSGTHYFSAGGTLAAVTGWSNAGNAYAPSSLVLGTLTSQPVTFLANSVEQMRITPAGNVGIGSTAAPAKLSVVSNAAASTVFVQNTNAAGSASIQFWDNTSTGIGFVGFSNVNDACELGTASAHPMGLYSSAVERIRIAATGEVGIGTSTPSTDLEVNGFTKLGSNAPAVKMLKLTGTTGAAEGGFVDIAHGLAASKILSVELLIEYVPGAWVTESYLAASEFQAHCLISASNIRVINHATNSGNILSKPVKLLITYEE